MHIAIAVVLLVAGAALVVFARKLAALSIRASQRMNLGGLGYDERDRPAQVFATVFVGVSAIAAGLWILVRGD